MMGNYKFRLSDMMPNAWFYKLRDMSRTRNHNTSRSVKKKLPSPTAASHKPNLSQPRHSYYYEFYNSPTNPKASDTHFPDPPPRKSSKRKTIYKPSPRLVTSSASTDFSCHHATLNSVWNKPEPTTQAQDYFSFSTDQISAEPEFESDTIDPPESFNGLASRSSSCSCRVTSSTTDIIIDMNEKSYTISDLQLPPVVTKPVKFKDTTSKAAKLGRSSSKFEEREAHGSLSVNIVKEVTSKTQKEAKTSPLTRKSGSYSAGVKLQANSPRIASKKVQAYGRRRSMSSSKSSKSQPRSFSESFAIVKSSFDPQRDFKDSMVEMIVENDIRASKDLEELLACYLSLNSDEYHDLIVKAFEQIWFDMDLRM